MAPDYVGIGGLFMFLLCSVGFIFAALGWAAGGENRAKGALIGVAIFLGLFTCLMLWAQISSAVHERGRNAMLADRRAAADRSATEVKNRCAAQERFEVHQPIKVGASILINVNPKQKSPTASAAPTVIPTDSMKLQVQKFGESFPPSNNLEQYVEPIAWVNNADQSEYIAEILHADLVETKDQYPDGDKMYKRLATRRRWEMEPDTGVVMSYTVQHREQLGFMDWPDDKFVMPISTSRSAAQYVFEVDDISTIDDRQHWVARGRMRLRDAGTSNVVAEYVGFQSILDRQAVCPKAKEVATREGNWDMLRFFFERVTEKS